MLAVLLQRFAHCKGGIFARRETSPGWFHSDPSSHGLIYLCGRSLAFSTFQFSVQQGEEVRNCSPEVPMGGLCVSYLQHYRGRYQEDLL